MKKGRFENIGTIFGFTFRQSATGKAFVFMTIVLPLMLFAVCFAANVIPAAVGDGNEASPVRKVYLIDDTGTQMVSDILLQLVDRERFPDMTVETVYGRSTEDVCGEISQSDVNSFVITAEKDTDEENVAFFRVTAVVPEWCEVPEDDYNELLSLVGTCMDSIKVYTAGIDYESLVYLSSYTYSDVAAAGETPDTLGAVMVKYVAPMLFMLVIYMMVILYGQSIGKVVVAEKNSKLMEMLLTSVQPDALIAGKIGAMACLALMQMLLWIVGAAAGFFAGNAAAKMIDPEFNNAVLDAIAAVTADNGAAFAPAAIILSVLALIFGFLLYCVLAGLVASCIGKTEQLANGMGVYNMLVIIGFFGAYFPVMMENEAVSCAVRIFPLTSAFCLSADTLVGNAGLTESALELLLLIVTNIVLIIAAARVYKAKVFYVGTNPITSGLGFLTKKHQKI